ncbi:hypothetical protein BD410DRAFT_126472 [Rickenella mellea]|uniref:Uncharacterized protein n=1 Tax=Rickenella mellea TaxID=50990 RepID=A0A4Y7Q891_9AGAM|nr:hypothetical protein BD410DRAFT_126472 [Rickenella mellea]
MCILDESSGELSEEREQLVASLAESSLARSIVPSTIVSLPITSSAAAQSAFQPFNDVPFGPNAAATGAWDQFAANERFLGITTQFDRCDYTTMLVNGANTARDFRAERIAAEIMGVSDHV